MHQNQYSFPKNSKLSYLFGFNEYKTHRRKQSVVESFTLKYNLTYLEWIVLQFANTNLTFTEVSEILEIKKNTLSIYAKRLEKNGYISFYMIYEDGYGKSMLLTKKGKKIYKEIESQLSQYSLDID